MDHPPIADEKRIEEIANTPPKKKRKRINGFPYQASSNPYCSSCEQEVWGSHHCPSCGSSRIGAKIVWKIVDPGDDPDVYDMRDDDTDVTFYWDYINGVWRCIYEGKHTTLEDASEMYAHLKSLDAQVPERAYSKLEEFTK